MPVVDPLGLGHAAAADLLGDLRLLDRQPAAAAAAVGPLRDAVDVVEGDAGDGAQQLARGLVHALALVQPARVVVGDGALDRRGQLDLALLDEVVDELDAEHDLELVVLAVVLRVVLGEGDVVVRVGRDDPLGADRAPVGDVVVGVLAGEVDVAHLRRRPAAAPLLAHQPELDAALLQQLGERARVGLCGRRPPRSRRTGSSRRRRGCPARRPSRRRAPAARRVSPSTGSLWSSREPLVPDPPGLALVAGLDHQRAHRLHDVDGARAVAVEVAGHQRVRAAQLARAALRAVHEVVGDVLDADEALLHRHDAGVERRGRVILVARDLHDGADLAAELVPGREAAVGVVTPSFDELVE